MKHVSRAVFAIVLLGAALTAVVGCDVLSPPPTVAPPETIALNDARLLVITDLVLSCEERMEEMAYLRPCTIEFGAQGREAHCTLEPPFETLMFGCGPKEERPAERLRLTLADARQAVAFRGAVEASFGVCSETCDVDGDTGTASMCVQRAPGRCYLRRGVHGSPLASGCRAFAPGRTGFPVGFFMELGMSGGATQEAAGEGVASSPRDVALFMETEPLTASERAAVVQQVETILSLTLAE